MHPKISVIIPNWNGKKFLPLCLSSLRNQTCTDFEIILVDNNSNDGSIEFVTQNYPEVIIVKNKINRGFAGGVNDGIRSACNNSKYIIVLNNDTKTESKWLEKLVEGAEMQSNIGMCASKVLKFDKVPIIDSAGLSISKDLDGFRRGRGRPDTAEFNTIQEVFGPVGSAALYKKSMLDEIGLFDEDFFAYVEDIELAWRARLAGWKCMYIPTAAVYHIHSGTWGAHSPQIIYYQHRNKLLMLFKIFSRTRIFKAFFQMAWRYFRVALLWYSTSSTAEKERNVSMQKTLKAILGGTIDAIIKLPVMRKKRQELYPILRMSDIEIEKLLNKFMVDERDFIK